MRFPTDSKFRSAIAREIAYLWCAVALALVYLEVPPSNSLIAAGVLILQANLGLSIILFFTPTSSPSLMLLVGPGLIIGSSASVAIFQLTGRGWAGLTSVLLVQGAALLQLAKIFKWESSQRSCWSLSQVLALASMVLLGEFPELLPASIVLLVAGLIPWERVRGHRVAQLTTPMLLALPPMIGMFLRPHLWWMVSDDYQFFQVLSRHITLEGPFSKYGAMDFSKYHWLSYAWSGLIDASVGTPAPYITVTRIMPFAYAFSLAASLLLVTRKLSPHTVSTQLAIWPALAITSLTRFDWSGVSTAAIFSVISAAVAVFIPLRDVQVNLGRKSVLAMLFLTIAILTKAPGGLMLAYSATFLMIDRIEQVEVSFAKRIARVSLAVATAALIVVAIQVLGQLTERFSLVEVQGGLGQNSYFGRNFALLLTTIAVTPLAVAVFIGMSTRKFYSSMPIGLFTKLTSIGLILATGIILEVSISGNANTYEYFADPIYYLVSLPLLQIVSMVDSRSASLHRYRICWILFFTGLSWLAGHLWTRLEIYERVGNSISGLFSEVERSFRATLLNAVLQDEKIGASVISLAVCLIFTVRLKQFLPVVAFGLLGCFVFLNLSQGVTSYLNSVNARQSSEITEILLGVRESRSVGEWIQANTEMSDLLGTNYLVNPTTGKPLSDFSLAVWSEREFLVLGPRFDGGAEFSSLAAPEVETSLEFGRNPSRENFTRLREYGIDWFVVDRKNSNYKDWEHRPEVRYLNQRFVVLKISWS